MTTIHVLLADDQAVVREGLESLLAGNADIEVVGLATDGLEAVRLAHKLGPDVVVMGMALPHLNGVDVTRRILEDRPECRILILSQHEDCDQILAALWAGASGYLLKRDAGGDLAESIRALVRYGSVLHPVAAQAVIDAYLRCECAQRLDSYARLTEREREVLVLVAEGHTNQQIADLLHVSPRTVDGHRTNLMSKLDLHDRTEVVKYALRRQLIEL